MPAPARAAWHASAIEFVRSGPPTLTVHPAAAGLVQVLDHPTNSSVLTLAIRNWNAVQVHN
ncbi:hypothetical protein, partial [Massilia phosphatilytica]